jgi:hypothetical protein
MPFQKEAFKAGKYCNGPQLCPGGTFFKLLKRRDSDEIERIRSPFGKLMKRAINSGERGCLFLPQ